MAATEWSMSVCSEADGVRTTARCQCSVNDLRHQLEQCRATIERVLSRILAAEGADRSHRYSTTADRPMLIDDDDIFQIGPQGAD